MDNPKILCKKCNKNNADYYKIVTLNIPKCVCTLTKKCDCQQNYNNSKNLILQKYKDISEFFVNLNTYPVYGNLKFYFYGCKDCVTDKHLLYLIKY
jgi:hypothetical protein